MLLFLSSEFSEQTEGTGCFGMMQILSLFAYFMLLIRTVFLCVCMYKGLHTHTHTHTVNSESQ